MSQLIKFGTTLRAASACAIVFAYGCAVDPGETAVQQASSGHTEIHPEDNCDPVTFGALCRAGFNGTTTLAQFRAEFAANFRVARSEEHTSELQSRAAISYAV